MTAGIPQRTKSAKTDSNRRKVKAMQEKERRVLGARSKAYRKARAIFARQRKAVLTREAIKKAKPIIERERNKFAAAALQLNGDVDAIADAKSRTRKSIDRALSRAVPRFKRYRAARDSYLTKHSTLFRKEMAGEATRFTKVLAANGLQSLGGAELSHSESPIPSFTPITLGFTTKDAFLKGERLQIFAGSMSYVGSDLASDSP